MFFEFLKKLVNKKWFSVNLKNKYGIIKCFFFNLRKYQSQSSIYMFSEGK
jgi:hypothetical protein